MIRVVSETRTVWRAEGGRRRARLTKRGAYTDAARAAYLEKYPHDDGLGIDADFVAAEAEARDRHYRRVVPRLARWLMWRDKRFGLAT